MAQREILLPWSQQPQEVAPLDWLNPINDKVAFAWRSFLADRPEVGLALTPTNAAQDVSQDGIVSRLTAGYWERTSYAPVVTSDGAGTGDFTAIVRANPAPSSTVYPLVCQRDGTGSFPQFAIIANSAGGGGSSTGSLEYYTFAGTLIGGNIASKIDGRWHTWGIRRVGTVVSVWEDGVQLASTSGTLQDITGASSGYAIGKAPGTALVATADFSFQWSSNRGLSDREMADITGNPWIVHEPQALWVPVAAGGGDPTEALTNNLATTAVGTAVPSLSLATTGNSATSAVGTVVPSLTVAETGNEVTASSGTVTPVISLALSGNAATASAGSVGIGGTTQAITGNAATTSTGAIAPSLTLALSGNGATASVGTVAIGGATQALTGNAATTSVGTPVASISLALTGNAATSSTGTVAPGLSKALTGNAATTAAGTPVAALSLALTGNAATSAAGTVDIPGIIVPTANEATASVGTVSPGITVALTGNVATTSVGSLSPAIALALSGLAGTSAAGIVIPGLTVSLTGNGATAAAGSAVPATGDINVALTGNAATAYAGSLAIGGFNSEWWRYEIPAQDLRYSVAPQSLTFTIER